MPPPPLGLAPFPYPSLKNPGSATGGVKISLFALYGDRIRAEESKTKFCP